MLEIEVDDAMRIDVGENDLENLGALLHFDLRFSALLSNLEHGFEDVGMSGELGFVHVELDVAASFEKSVSAICGRETDTHSLEMRTISASLALNLAETVGCCACV